MIAAVEGVNTSDAQRRARDPGTGKAELVSDMTYQEWVKQKEAAKEQSRVLRNSENKAILKAKIESSEISTKIRPQVQARHTEGTQQFEEYKTRRLAKGQTPQSILTVTAEEAQEIVDRYYCTGAVDIQQRHDGTVKIIEYCDADEVIGRYYKDDAYHAARRFAIYYSKKGTHIVPTVPKEDS